MNINAGRILEHTVRMERISISELSRRLNVSRCTVYNWFKQEDLNPSIILRVGDVIGYDFTEEFPQVLLRNHRHNLPSKHAVLQDSEADANSVYFWMKKYVILLERYNEMLNKFSEKIESDYVANNLGE